MKTRREIQNHLESLGMNGAALELLLKMGAEARHSHRVEMTIDAALRFIDGKPQNLQKNAANALVLCLADKTGIGGRFGMEGASTDRLPCFRKLGKGRKQATDGSAYMAALDGAIEGLCAFAVGDRYARMKWDVRDKSAFLRVESSALIIESDDIRELLPYEWQAAIAAHELVRHSKSEDGSGAVPEYLPVWSTIYNDACDPAATKQREARTALSETPEVRLTREDVPSRVCRSGMEQFIRDHGLREGITFAEIAAHPQLEELLREEMFVETILQAKGRAAFLLLR